MKKTSKKIVKYPMKENFSVLVKLKKPMNKKINFIILDLMLKIL